MRKTTREAIIGALETHGKRSGTDLLISVRGTLGQEPDDYRDVLDELLSLGKVTSEVNDYLQEDIYSLANQRSPAQEFLRMADPSSDPAWRRMNAEPDPIPAETVEAIFSAAALKSVQAQKSEERTRQEQRYDALLSGVVLKPEGHTEMPLPEEVAKHNGKRVYAVTTIASSDKYGGTRTPVACDSFEAARKIVEENQGDIWECSYMLVVIEATVLNWLYHNLDERYWYVWRDGAYKAIECPAEYTNTCGFGIG